MGERIQSGKKTSRGSAQERHGFLCFILPAILILIVGFILYGVSVSGYWNGDGNPNKIVQIDAGPYHYLARTNAGAVLYTGQNRYKEGDVQDWTNAVDISAGNKMSTCVTSSGRVLLAGSLEDQISEQDLNPDIGSDISGWRDMVQVDAGGYEVYGLKADGTVDVASWRAIIKNKTDVPDWQDITKVLAWYGLQKDGTVLMHTSRGSFPLWTDIVDIEQSPTAILGLKADGTVVYRNWVAENLNLPDRFTNLRNWTDIVALAVDSGIIAGLRSDGTVILDEAPEAVREEVASWTDVIAISAGFDYLIGLTSDGTVLSTAPFEGVTP